MRLATLLTILCAVIAGPTAFKRFKHFVPQSLKPSFIADGDQRAAEVARRIGPQLEKDLSALGLTLGSPIYIRSFKEEKQLELWVQEPKKETYALFRTYHIAAASGDLGPKRAEGDHQTPEGFYSIKKSQLHPASRYHLAYNIGFPNSYDRSNSRTGSFIMIHGSTASIGCFAMTDEKIEEIYTLAAAALEKGQKSFQHHSFPFRMTPRNVQRHGKSPHLPFWEMLKPAYTSFEESKRVPKVTVHSKRYHISND